MDNMLYYSGKWWIMFSEYKFATWVLLAMLVSIVLMFLYNLWLGGQNEKLKNENSKLKSMLSISEFRKAELLDKYEGKN